jgi:branched-chain amino acid transport system substrate-binding protein
MGLARIARAARRWLAVAPLTAAVGLAACGGNDSGGTTEPAATSVAKPAAQTGGTAAKPITDFLGYVGGKAGRADSSKKPVVLGWVNAQGGAQSFPEATKAAQATVRYVNAELGGVDGHPLALHTCFIANAEEEGQRCGQRMANDDAADAILFGLVIIGNQSFFSQIAGKKPVIMGVANNPVDTAGKNTYAFFGSGTSVLAPYGTYMRDVLKAKTAAIVFPSQAGTIPIANATKKGLEDAGLKVKSVGYDAQATDLLGPITAAGGQTADVITPQTDVPGCINFAKALQQSSIDTPIVATPLCLNQQVAKALGGDLPKWTFGIAQDIPSDPANPSAKAYNEVMTKNGATAEDASSVFAALAFSDVLATVKILNGIGSADLSADSIGAAAKQFKGPIIMGPPNLQCGKYPSSPGVCNDQTQFFDYEGKGKFKRVAGWLKPPK